MAETKILFCPGIGANGEMFDDMIEKMEKLSIKVKPTYLEFPKPVSKRESLPDYAVRAFSSPEIKNKKFDLVVACSFGGMLYQEAFKQKLIKDSKSVLICTAYSGNDIQNFFSIGMPLARFFPGFLHRPVQIFIAVLYPILRFRRPWARKFSRMFLKTDPAVFFTAPAMIYRWNRNQDYYPVLPDNVIQFHGTKDPLISYKKISEIRVPEFPLYKRNHIIFATEVDFIVKEITNFI
ncbi:MAG: hypothetical protein OEZ34_03270 [Spirochaetia bacterium]|nr:hypothetical protein [Spirochaetia bacterium]